MRPWLCCAMVAAVALASAPAGGCGGDESMPAPAAELRPVGGGGELAYATADAPTEFDPLDADSISEQTVLRQVYEPLVERLDAPYGGPRNVAGPAGSVRRSSDYRVWSLRLRSGIRFQDGQPLNASAVLANVERWRSSTVGRELLPGLIAADGPRPDLVRFVFGLAMRDLPRRLSDPRLGLVSPAALEAADADPPSSIENAGSGPFRLVTARPQSVSLERFRGWWGTRRGLGPALDEIAFRIVARPEARLALLRDGAVRVAGDIGEVTADRLQASALLTAVGAGGSYAIGLERSVRGIDDSRPAPLSGAWVASLDQAG